MKVLRITAALNYGGIEKVFELHAKYHRKDYELVFVALEGGGRVEGFIRNLGYRVILLNSKCRIPSWKCFRELVALFKQERPDVIHTCGAEANFHGLLAAFWCGIPRRLGEEIGIPGHSTIAKMIFRAVYLTADRVIAISRSVGEYLTNFEVPGNKLAVIYNPIDVGIIRQTKTPTHEGIRLSCACRLEPIKNLPMLIDLLATLITKYPHKRCELWLIGEGSQRQYLTRYAREKGVSDKVTFTGFVDNPYQLLVQTDVFILASLFEGFGLACIEAIQCGLPVIVSRSGGMKEYITDGVNGFLFDPASLDELVLKMDSLLGLSQEERNMMTIRALATINDLFSPEKYLDQLGAVYGSGEKEKL